MERRTEGRKEGSVTISLRNFVGEGIKKPQNINRQYLRCGITVPDSSDSYAWTSRFSWLACPGTGKDQQLKIISD
jgi:hypothetical protein